MDVYKKEYGNDFDKMTELFEDHRSIKKEKKDYIRNNLALLTINGELANIVNKNEDLLMTFD